MWSLEQAVQGRTAECGSFMGQGISVLTKGWFWFNQHRPKPGAVWLLLDKQPWLWGSSLAHLQPGFLSKSPLYFVHYWLPPHVSNCKRGWIFKLSLCREVWMWYPSFTWFFFFFSFFLGEHTIIPQWARFSQSYWFWIKLLWRPKRFAEKSSWCNFLNKLS